MSGWKDYIDHSLWMQKDARLECLPTSMNMTHRPNSLFSYMKPLRFELQGIVIIPIKNDEIGISLPTFRS